MSARRLIAQVITRLEQGGAARNVIDSCAALAASYDVVLLAGPHGDSASLLKLLPPGVRYIEIESLQAEINPVKDFTAFQELKEQLSLLRPDLVHTHTFKAGALGRLAAASAGRANNRQPVTIHTPHGHCLYGYYGPVKTFLLALTEKWLSRSAGSLIALTPGEMREAEEAGIGRPDQWTVIHDGVRLELPGAPAGKKDLGVAEDEIVIGTAARLERVEGVQCLLRAAACLRERFPAARLRFVIIGGGEMETPLKKLSRRLGVSDIVVFTGVRPDAAALMGAMDIYVQPSLNQAMAPAVLQAQALGLPVIVSRAGGLPDMIEEGKTGLAVKRGDAEALAAAIERLMLSNKLRERMGAAGKTWATVPDHTGFPRFCAETMKAQLLALYSGVLGRKPGED